ncbi:phosphoribosylglycinamide formyltransferase [Marinilabiliaceae bacterium ANBcel2]|nr:phosphoribosylglycinamide formyltransferase [Marinilabiliaceae bacterium ANBcel2]
MKKIVLFASGSGSNAENIIKYFQKSKVGDVIWLLSNKKDAYALTRAKNLGVKSKVFSREEFYNSKTVIDFLKEVDPDIIVLAGFLWLIPSSMVSHFRDRIINIHPALLPHYGGKGMYGDNVHKAVIENGEDKSGITIHYVNEKYDDGNIIFQASCKVDTNDDPASLASKVHELEYEYYPRVIEKILCGEEDLLRLDR